MLSGEKAGLDVLRTLLGFIESLQWHHCSQIARRISGRQQGERLLYLKLLCIYSLSSNHSRGGELTNSLSSVNSQSCMCCACVHCMQGSRIMCVCVCVCVWGGGGGEESPLPLVLLWLEYQLFSSENMIHDPAHRLNCSLIPLSPWLAGRKFGDTEPRLLSSYTSPSFYPMPHMGTPTGDREMSLCQLAVASYGFVAGRDMFVLFPRVSSQSR